MYEELASDLSVTTPRREEGEMISAVERVIEEKYGEVGVENVMPEVRERLEEMDSRISKVEKEIQESRNLTHGILEDALEDPEFEKILLEKIDEIVSEKMEPGR